MKAIVIENPGPEAVLRWQEVQDPVPTHGEILVRVAATGLNRADLMQVAGHYPPPPGASPYPGLECSGEVVALGAGTTRFKVGDSVCALLAGGGYAELVAVPEGQALPVPEGVSLRDAAGIPEVFATAYANLYMEAGAQPGDRLLIHAGGSGVGTAAVYSLQSETDADPALEPCEDIVIAAWQSSDDRGEEWRSELFGRTLGDLERHLDRQIRFEELIDERDRWLEPREFVAGETLEGSDAQSEGLQFLLSGRASA